MGYYYFYFRVIFIICISFGCTKAWGWNWGDGWNNWGTEDDTDNDEYGWDNWGDGSDEVGFGSIGFGFLHTFRVWIKFLGSNLQVHTTQLHHYRRWIWMGPLGR